LRFDCEASGRDPLPARSCMFAVRSFSFSARRRCNSGCRSLSMIMVPCEISGVCSFRCSSSISSFELSEAPAEEMSATSSITSSSSSCRKNVMVLLGSVALEGTSVLQHSMRSLCFLDDTSSRLRFRTWSMGDAWQPHACCQACRWLRHLNKASSKCLSF